MRLIILSILILALLMASSGCSSSSPVTSSTPPPTASPGSQTSTSTPTASNPGQTFGQLATSGKTVFANKCAKCHGDTGQGVTGPALIGSSSQLGKYNTAQGLLNFVKLSMPFDAPGSLSQQDYLNVLSYLLVQNNYVPAGNAFDPNQLGNIQLK